jgi:hypothetical protein
LEREGEKLYEDRSEERREDPWPSAVSFERSRNKNATQLPAMIDDGFDHRTYVRPEDVYNQLSPAKYYSALVIVIISCLLSIIGSITIAYLIVRKRLWQKDFFQRIMLCLCVADLISTVATLFQPLVLPRFTRLPLAFGTVRSCEAAAFLSLFVWASYLYSAEISLYFLLTIRYHWKEDRIKSVLEPWVHILPWVFPLILGSVALAFSCFNPSSVLGVCTFATYPVDCRLIHDDPDACERCGYDKLRFVLWPAGAMAVVAASIGFIGTWLVFWTVRNQSRRSNRFDYEVSSGSKKTSTMTAHREKRIRAVAWQAFFYAMGFMNAFFVPLVSMFLVFYITASRERIYTQNDSGLPFFTMLLMYAFYPVQGFINWMVYCRPIIVRWKDCHQDRSWWWCYQQLLACRPTPWTARTAHLTHTVNNNDSDSVKSSSPRQDKDVNHDEPSQEQGQPQRQPQQPREQREPSLTEGQHTSSDNDHHTESAEVVNDEEAVTPETMVMI